MTITRLAVVAFTALSLSCGSVQREAPSNSPSSRDVAAEVARPAEPANANSKDIESPSANTACRDIKVADRSVLKSQTFAIDFAPFKGSCFVTTHEPDYTDPPLGADVAIYKDGKRVEAFLGKGDNQGVSSSDAYAATCWVEAVAFQDVSLDDLTDVIVVSKCGAKDGSYQDNHVYLNNGKYLLINRTTDAELDDLKTIKQIVDYIKLHPNSFSLTIDAANSNSKS